jgi:hypothetical protein
MEGEHMELELNLTVEEINIILSVLGDLPSKTGAWVLISKIKAQAEPQLVQASPEETETEPIPEAVN